MYNGNNVTVGQAPMPNMNFAIMPNIFLNLLPSVGGFPATMQQILNNPPTPVTREDLTDIQLADTLQYYKEFIPITERLLALAEEAHDLSTRITAQGMQHQSRLREIEIEGLQVQQAAELLREQYEGKIPDIALQEVAYAIAAALALFQGQTRDSYVAVLTSMHAGLAKAKEVYKRLKGPNYLLYGGIGVGIIAAGTTAYFMLRKPKPTPKKRRRKKSKRNK